MNNEFKFAAGLFWWLFVFFVVLASINPVAEGVVNLLEFFANNA